MFKGDWEALEGVGSTLNSERDELQCDREALKGDRNTLNCDEDV